MSLTQPLRYHKTKIKQQIVFMHPEHANQALAYLLPEKKYAKEWVSPNRNGDTTMSKKKQKRAFNNADTSQRLINKLAVQGAGLAGLIADATELKGVHFQNEHLCATASIMSDLFNQIDQLNDL
jgi:hypothetical protein